jgi:hypothetical protein
MKGRENVCGKAGPDNEASVFQNPCALLLASTELFIERMKKSRNACK